MAKSLIMALSCSVLFVAIFPAVFIRAFAQLFQQQQTLRNTRQGRDGLGGAAGTDLFYHLGGNGPWIPKIDGTVEGGIDPPEGCRVTQVHMIARHAERYPTVAAGARMWSLYQRLQDINVTLKGDLAFAKDWDFFMEDPNDIENLVSTGPYAGTLEAFTTGVKLRTRYKDLIDKAHERGHTTFWASDSARVIDSARYFGAGFFGIGDSHARLKVISEGPERGADTLTPGRTCLNYRNDIDPRGRAYGYKMMDAIRSTYEPSIVSRLAKQNPDFAFTEDEVFTMQLFCGFETIAKGSSPWCDVFTEDEWESFEYARDAIHYYRSGPGNPFGAVMGWLWLNATANLLAEGEEAGPLFFSFVHDGDIIPLLAALELYPQHPDLPTTHVLHNRTFRTSDLVPMGGRIIFERLACPRTADCWSNAPFYPNHVYCAPPEEEIFVRVNINDGIVAIPGCKSGPGGSCPLEEFLARVKATGEKAGDFQEICGLRSDGPDRISFLHQRDHP